jgi:hypothetical protein
MSRCTWIDCTNEATTPQISKDGSQWANLCPGHAKEIDDNLLDAKGILRCWVRAQGGSKAIVGKMRDSGDIDKMARFAAMLSKRVKR